MVILILIERYFSIYNLAASTAGEYIILAKLGSWQ